MIILPGGKSWDAALAIVAALAHLSFAPGVGHDAAVVAVQQQPDAFDLALLAGVVRPLQQFVPGAIWHDAAAACYAGTPSGVSALMALADGLARRCGQARKPAHPPGPAGPIGWHGSHGASLACRALGNPPPGGLLFRLLVELPLGLVHHPTVRSHDARVETCRPGGFLFRRRPGLVQFNLAFPEALAIGLVSLAMERLGRSHLPPRFRHGCFVLGPAPGPGRLEVIALIRLVYVAPFLVAGRITGRTLRNRSGVVSIPFQQAHATRYCIAYAA